MRDSHAILIVVDAAGVAVSKGTTLADELAGRYRRPVLVIDLNEADAGARAAAWLDQQVATFGDALALGIGGPRESEAPGIYERAKAFLAGVLKHPQPPDGAGIQAHVDRGP